MFAVCSDGKSVILQNSGDMSGSLADSVVLHSNMLAIVREGCARIHLSKAVRMMLLPRLGWTWCQGTRLDGWLKNLAQDKLHDSPSGNTRGMSKSLLVLRRFCLSCAIVL